MPDSCPCAPIPAILSFLVGSVALLTSDRHHTTDFVFVSETVNLDSVGGHCLRV